MKLAQLRKDFAEKMKETGLTQTEVSAICCVPQVYISRFKRGKGLAFDTAIRLWPFVYGQPFPSPPSPTPPAATEGSHDAV